MRKAFSLALVALLFAGFFLPIPLAASEYCSIQDLQEQASELWQQTYETKWRTIEVNAEIAVPQEDALPIVRFQENTKTYPVEEKYFADHDDRPVIGMTYNSPTLTDTYAKYTKDHIPGTFPQEQYYRRPWDMARAYAYNNPFTLQEAVVLLDELLLSVTGGDVQPYVTDVSTGLWVRRKRNPDGSVKPYRDKGYYFLKFRQAFQGIPLFNAPMPSKYSEDLKWPPAADGGGYWVASRDEFRFDIIFPREEMETLVSDVPVLPLNKILPVYEKLIMDGHVRDVASLEFGYVPFWETKEHTTLIAYPCWILISEYETKPSRNRAAFFEEKENYTANPVQGIGYNLIVNAQTGELFHPSSIGQDELYVPKILTWDDVGGRK